MGMAYGIGGAKTARIDAAANFGPDTRHPCPNAEMGGSRGNPAGAAPGGGLAQWRGEHQRDQQKGERTEKATSEHARLLSGGEPVSLDRPSGRSFKE